MLNEIKAFIENHIGTSVYSKVFLIVLTTIIIWLLFCIILKFVEKRALKYKIIRFSDNFFKLIKKICRLVAIFFAGTYIINILNIAVIENFFYALLILFFSGPLHGIMKIILEFLKDNLAHKTKSDIDDIVIDLLDKFSGIIIYATAIIISLDTLGVNVMPFIAGAGVAGVAIGFAAKDTLSNFIAGVLLLIDRPFEIGDRIEVWNAPAGSATWGDVVNIGLRATKIKTTDNIEIIIPNNEIMTRDIINYTATSSSIRVRINIGVAYDADIKKTKEIIIRMAQSLDWVQNNPAPKVVVRNFGESSIDLQLRVWINNARKRMDTISNITDMVKEEFDKAGIEIPFPKRDITIINKSDI